MNEAIAPGSHAEKSPHKGEHDNARTHTHTRALSQACSHLWLQNTPYMEKKKSTNKDIFEQEQKKFLK